MASNAAGVKSALTVSWSDPTGCDGIAADLRTFGAFAVHGSGIVAGIRTEEKVTSIPVPDLEGQIRRALSALGPAPVKVTFMGIPETDIAIAAALVANGVGHVVLDASSSAPVSPLTKDAVDVFKSNVGRHAEVLVTDIAGAQSLAGVKIANQTAMRPVAKLLCRLGPRFVLIAGSQLPGDDVTDIMFDGTQNLEFPGERFTPPEPTGVASTYACAVTAGLAHGRSVEEAVAIARIYVTETMRSAFPVGESLATSSQLYAWWAGTGRQGYGG